MVADAPLQQWRNGDFSGYGPITDPTTGQPFANDVIPADRISPVSQNIQNSLYPQPNYGPPGLTSGNFRQTFPGVTGFTKFNLFDARLDYNPTNRDLIFGRVSWRGMYLDGSDFPPTIGHWTQERLGKSAVLSWTHTFSPVLVNEFRTGAIYHANNYNIVALGGDVVKEVGLQGVSNAALPGGPAMLINGITDMDWDSNSDQFTREPDTSWQWTDNVSWTKGNHFLKFGFDAIREDQNYNISTSNVFGKFSFSGIYTGVGYADFLLGIPQTSTLAVADPPHYLRGTTMGLYAQDQFKVSRKLTLNYGLRWELQPPYHSTNGAIYSFDPQAGALVIPDIGASQVNPYFPTNIPVVTASKAEIGRAHV
jgi:hypothetical protein